MASPRDGKAAILAEETDNSAPAVTESNTRSATRKRKVKDVQPAEDEVENVQPLSPSNSKKLKTEEDAQDPRERTPGRDGPIKEEDFTLEPDIKPFKGPPGHKVRKTAREKEEEYTQFCRDNEGHPFHELHICFDKGPNGSPTYDKSGFQLDYHKVAEWMRPTAYNKGRMVNGMQKAVDKSQEEERRMAEIFYEKGEAPEKPDLHQGCGFWKDRVSKDLNVPWHKITVKHFEEWEQKGFKKAKRGEYENFTPEERKRELRLLSGASLRK